MTPISSKLLEFCKGKYPKDAKEWETLSHAEKVTYTRDFLSEKLPASSKIQLGTHSAKAINPKAKGVSININISSIDSDAKYLCGLSTPSLDAFRNAAENQTAVILTTKDDNGVTLFEKVASGDYSDLEALKPKKSELESWIEYIQSPETIMPNPDTFSKQVFFPVSGGKYHNLIPVPSTSLYAAVFERVMATRQKVKLVEGATRISFFNLTKIQVGGDKPQNVSTNFSATAGTAFLFSCEPPVYEQQTKPDGETILDFTFSKMVYRDTTELIEFLAKDKPQNKQTQQELNRRYLQPIYRAFIGLVEMHRNSLNHDWVESDECLLKTVYKNLILREKIDSGTAKGCADDLGGEMSEWLIEKTKDNRFELGDNHYNYFKKVFTELTLMHFKSIKMG